MFSRLRKKNKTIYDEIRDFVDYQKMSTLVEKAKNLLKLGRREEASEVFANAERIALHSVQNSPDSFHANLLLAIFYNEADNFDRSETILNNLLTSKRFKVSDNQRIILEGALLKIQREKPIRVKNKHHLPDEFTKIYSCQSCGRIINYVTMPCSHCQWYPTDLSSLARSIILSNPSSEVPALLLLAREVSKGRLPSEVVANLEQNAQEYYEMPESETKLGYMFDLLQQNANRNMRDMNMVRACPACGESVLLSHEEECSSCGEAIVWPDPIKFLVCMDNLMWLFEQRVEVTNSREFAEFVCLLVAMITELLRKQEAPSISQRKYALSLMRDIQSISDTNKGVVIDTTHPEKLKIYLVKESMLEDSEQFGQFLFSELEFFVKKMIDGINL